MKLQCKTANTDSFFLINQEQFQYLQTQDMVYEQIDKKSKQRTKTTRIRVFWNAFQRDGSKLQADSIASGLFATSYEVQGAECKVNSVPEHVEGQNCPVICGEEIGDGFYAALAGKLKEGHKALMDKIRLIYLNPDNTRLIIISEVYEGYKNIKACQTALNKALGWQSTKGCCNLNRDYPFPLRDSVLFEDARMWNEEENEGTSFMEYDKESNMYFIGKKENWIPFTSVVEMLENRAEKKLRDIAYEYDQQEVECQHLTDDQIEMMVEQREERERMMSDYNIPKVWPFPFDMIARIAPYNFIRPVLVATCFHVVTMLSAFKGSKMVKFVRKDHRGQETVKMVNQSVNNGMFMILEAPPSSGKQSFSFLDSLMWSEHMKEDAETYELENEYNDKLNRKSQNKEMPKKPVFKISVLSPKSSFAQLNERISNNMGRMMKSFTTEMDDLFTSLANGSSVKKISKLFSAFLRMVKDQDMFSVDYKIPTAKKGFYMGRINYFICGTPGARQNTFPDPEDGLVSRLWFLSLNPDDGSGEPVYDDMTDTDKERLLEFQRWCIESRNEMEETGEFLKIEGSEFVYDVLKRWEDEVVEKAIDRIDTTTQHFVRRAKDDVNAVGCVLYLLFKRYHSNMSERKIRNAVTKLVLWLAEQRLWESCIRYDIQDTEALKSRAKDFNVYDTLPETFMLNDLRELMIKAKNVSEPGRTISDWVRRGKIKRFKDENGVMKFKKIKKI